MGTWIYPWKSGDVTAVTAPSKADAIDFLEAIGPVDMAKLEPFTRGFAVTFEPMDNGLWQEKAASSGLKGELNTFFVDSMKRKRCRSRT
jgi:hypothetical protein